MSSTATAPATTEVAATVTPAETTQGAPAPTMYASPMTVYSAPVTYAAPTASYIAPTMSYMPPVGTQETSPGVYTSPATGLTYDAPVITMPLLTQQPQPAPALEPAITSTTKKDLEPKKEAPVTKKAAPKKKGMCC